MDRRRFLDLAARTGAVLSISSPLLGREGSPATLESSAGEVVRTPSTLVTSLNGEWSIATDAANVGREQKWFQTPSPDAKSTPVPSIIQEIFPALITMV